ncbi:MAG: GMC family oxidoreductase [Deltaproteobacteria bacterium]|nr:GMC family oxidoreductase [Deltaproteobacteria bacterium]
MQRLETQVAVVGTGPGGACLARELSARNVPVVLLERGPRHERLIGSRASMGTVTRLARTIQGGIMGRGVTVGGSSVVFNGNAYDPPAWLADLGMDLAPHVAAIKEEIGVKPLPESHTKGWTGTQRLLEAADALGMPLRPQNKFIDAEKCLPTCDSCMLGCKRDAKWTARRMVDQAVEKGAVAYPKAPVESVIVENGRAAGVRLGRNRHGVREVRARTVVLAAGGLGTPLILRRSGFSRAGSRFFIDPMNVVMGVGKEKGTWKETTFSFACEDFADEGFLVSTVGAAPVLAAQLTRLESFRALFRSVHMSRVVGMFTKIGDEPSGRILDNGRIDKPYGKRDRDLFERGTGACLRIMEKAGVDPATITVARDIGGHPGGTAAIGEVCDENLQVRGARGLYVCDASAFPRSPGRPPTLTILSMARWLAERL